MKFLSPSRHPLLRLRRLFVPGAALTRYSEYVQGVLGTSLELQVLAHSQAEGQEAIRAALNEIERLEHVFSRFDPHSELNRWLSDLSLRPSEELSSLLRRAEQWRIRTGGAFHPGSEALTQLWHGAEQQDQIPEHRGTEPDKVALAGVLARLNSPVWSEEDGWRPAVPLNLNAFAKGYIVDKAAQAAYSSLQPGSAAQVLVNIGGDLRHIGAPESEPGTGGVPVDVMNPQTPYDNAAPLTRIHLQGGGLATSGGAFRGFVIGGKRASHVLDPRSGHPVSHVVSASVLAPTCADADALATAFSVLRPSESLALTEQLPGVACLLVLADGQQQRSRKFPPPVLTAD
ncbi:FAD:protein FMN transferase (plasmid) [Deinococcus sp. KNUC1210]|uniref:FAD:protein FMN transferase n=1 Tax=Deinococcus sp. KNUC1210 TaxID=2917691 RepID=UPI001EF06926|nr:FAD:protein FMN transferase [Deinococcus sp. KNUC1210]ULH17271.1 FAD:protein FMN transferase [Deinococcus sp. KNUC1210]